MPSNYPVDQIVDALSALFTGFKDHTDAVVYVDNVSDKVLNNEDTINTKRLPCILFMFAGTTWSPKRDLTRVTYGASNAFVAIAGWRNLRNEAVEQLGALKFITAIADKLAGQRLQLEGGVNTEPIELQGCELLEMSLDGTWYQIDFNVGCLAQFSSK